MFGSTCASGRHDFVIPGSNVVGGMFAAGRTKVTVLIAKPLHNFPASPIE
jgi:hypothetical protein